MTDGALLSDLVAAARAAGADEADALLVRSASLSVQIRLGEAEHVERAEARDLGLRVFVGRRGLSRATARSPARRPSAAPSSRSAPKTVET